MRGKKYNNILSDLDNNDLPNEHKENKTSAPLTVSVNGQRGCLFVICFASGAVPESAFAAKIVKWVNRSID